MIPLEKAPLSYVAVVSASLAAVVKQAFLHAAFSGSRFILLYQGTLHLYSRAQARTLLPASPTQLEEGVLEGLNSGFPMPSVGDHNSSPAPWRYATFFFPPESFHLPCF